MPKRQPLPGAGRYLVSLGRALQAARERRGLSQGALGDAIDVDRLSGIERGRAQSHDQKPFARGPGALDHSGGTIAGGGGERDWE